MFDTDRINFLFSKKAEPGEEVTSQQADSGLPIFKSLFKGREDAFAIRWEKGGKSGYMPAYHYDPYRYRIHKMKGGSFATYSDKTYLPLTNDRLLKHLNGSQVIGIYPLLKDNHSNFIVADFDKLNWTEESRKFIECCNSLNIPAYLERSRSGKGGHAWIFFEQPYPAIKSRKIIFKLLTDSGNVSVFDKNSSFDRLFPNQDTLSGKGLGNLIALPLHKLALEEGNSCFIDPHTLQPFSDQWHFLTTIQRASAEKLNSLYQAVITDRSEAIPKRNGNGSITISLSNNIRIGRPGIPLSLVNFLREELNFVNLEFIIKKKSGKNTFGTERYFRLIEETESNIIIPKGFAGKLLRFCKESNTPFQFKDERKRKDVAFFRFQATLREYQATAFTAISKKDMGIIVAPPGSGKTIIGLKLIADKQQPALIVVHRIQLMEQWIERIEAFLGIPKHEIGKIGQGKTRLGKQITVATIQTLSKELEKPENSGLQNAFGTIVIDECHHIPAESYKRTIQKLNSFYLYGLTATPFRKYNDGKLIFIHLGEIIAEITPQETGKAHQAKIIIRNTELDVPFNSKTDRYETLSKVLVHDSLRNKQILQDIISELNARKRIVIITERKEHIDSLYQYLKQSYDVVTLSGDDSESTRSDKWRILKEGNFQALITTGQLFGEGTDLHNVGVLFLVYPFSFEGKLIQYIGRVQRSEITPVIYDYRDIKIDYLNKLFLKRNTYYRKLSKQVMLFDDAVEEPAEESKVIAINKEMKVAIESLEFRYGGVGFKYTEPGINMCLDFEIMNDEVRPEFEVLKPYFAKTLGTKNIDVSIYAEIESGQLVAQSAISDDVARINREVIEGVRFRFVSKNILGKIAPPVKENLLDIKQVQSGHMLYESGQELLESILTQNQYKHHRQLRYLAEKHSGNLLSVRFVLSPFSFVFLLEGVEQFHIILETLDTEEATYLWHFEKDLSFLKIQLREIDRDLDVIRNKGRQAFLLSPPENFSRILHDYTNEQKGFVIWKDLLEERLI